jgi:hypothetical protein
MKGIFKIRLQSISILLYMVAFSSIACAQPKLNPVIENKVEALLKRMTLEEKVGQMAQISIESAGSSKGNVFTFSEKMKDAVINYKLGSILNSPGPLQSVKEWNRIITEIQDAANQTRLKIPVIYGLDHIHGVTYIAGGNIVSPANSTGCNMEPPPGIRCGCDFGL